MIDVARYHQPSLDIVGRELAQIVQDRAKLLMRLWERLGLRFQAFFEHPW